MLPSLAQLRRAVELVLVDKAEQGHDVDAMANELAALPDSYDDVAALVAKVGDLPRREDWPWDEPDDLDAIRVASRADRARAEDASRASEAARIETAFAARVAGCVLGKPFEMDLTLEELEVALGPVNEWPLRDYVTEAGARSLPGLIGQWGETVRERIRYVAPDDDINYTIIGMLLLERHGAEFTVEQLRDTWLLQLPVAATFGPERTMLARAAMESLDGGDPGSLVSWADVLNPRDEWCGALIRVDAYGYACPGDPERATALAWRDASFTHRRTGVYAAMFVAAALALAPVRDDPLSLFDDALGFVPQRSRFAAAVTDALTEVGAAGDWLDGYRRVHERWPEHTHCRIYQEVATLVNTLRFASDAGDAICKQVSQGNDTDSYGATAGSLAGLLFGPGSLDERWIAPFGDDLRTALALFHERSLARVGQRLARLPAILRGDVTRPESAVPY
jgi:ADP-ribosylglycohydrolase